MPACVWTYDFAVGLTLARWRGDINGRASLLHHKRALILTSTTFDTDGYDAGVRDGMGSAIDDWGFRFPGVQDVEHVYFCATTSATPDLVRQCFRQAYKLGLEFDRPAAAGPPTPAT
ncbi:MAG: hypothetical protein WAV54_06160 [Acidimicrobiales bacterium]